MENLLNADILTDYLLTYGAIFLGGFGVTVFMHYLAYGIFGAFSLLKNTEKL